MNIYQAITEFSHRHPYIWIGILIILALLLAKLIHTIYLMRPITEKEIEKWAKHQREKEAAAYFQFDTEPPRNLKKTYESEKPLVDASGSEIGISIPFRYGPACIAYWLKHKKHQWVIAMYCLDQNNFTRIYGNKGPDNQSVECLLRPNRMMGPGKRNSYNTVLLFHNHPMSISPRITEEDRTIAKERKQIAKDNDWNYLEFICVRGGFRLFASHYSSQFKSIKQYKTEFQELGKRGALANLKFRWEKYY